MPLGQMLSIGASALSGGLFTKLVDWARSRERTAMGVLHKEIDALRAQVGKLEKQVEAIRDEKHEALESLFVSRMNEVLLKVEVNEELRKQGEPPRYDVRLSSQDEKQRQLAQKVMQL